MQAYLWDNKMTGYEKQVRNLKAETWKIVDNFQVSGMRTVVI